MLPTILVNQPTCVLRLPPQSLQNRILVKLEFCLNNHAELRVVRVGQHPDFIE